VDRLREIVVFDDRVQPHRLDQGSSRHGFAGVLDEINERIERLRGQRDGFVVGPLETAVRRIEAKMPESVNISRNHGQRRLLG
jgi:hypothetical protein